MCRGNVSVRIYPYPKNGSVSYNVADYSSGRRRFRGFSNLSEAKCEAELIAARRGVERPLPHMSWFHSRQLNADESAKIVTTEDAEEPTGN